jgi:hypothetical protein
VAVGLEALKLTVDPLAEPLRKRHDGTPISELIGNVQREVMIRDEMGVRKEV